MLEAFRHGRPTVNPQPKTKEKMKSVNTKKVEVKNEVSDSEETEVDYNTDDESYKTDTKHIENNVKKEVDDFSDILQHTNSKENIPSISTNYSSTTLLNDSPPHAHHLPKRVKYDHKTDDTVSVSTFNAASSKDKINKQEEEIEENSPCDTYDTQDLLDFI